MALPLIAAAAAPGLISGIANIFGGRRRRKEEKKAASGISQLADIFNQQLTGNYFDTGEAKGAITEINQGHQESQNAINNTAAATGMTDEAKISLMGKNNKAKAGAFSNLAGMADLWRSRLLNQRQGALSNLFQIGQQNRQNFNQSLSSILNPLSEGLGAAINAGAFDQ